MDNDVKPLHAAAIIIFFIVLILSYAWINARVVETTGPDGIYKNQHNQLFVRIQTELLQFDTSGKFIKSIDLKKLGVEYILGDILFMPDNEIILRRGKDSRSFTQNIKSFLRLDDTSSSQTTEDSSGLFRCSLNSYTCYRFTKIPLDFNSAYHLEYDKFDGGIFLSDTGRHRILKFDKQGALLFEYNTNLKFPNQIQLHNNQLYIANTNHHEITLLNIKQNDFVFNKDISIFTPASKEKRETWPTALQHINDNWWVINMNSDMQLGGVYIYDMDWNFIKRINTKPNADPINILQWPNKEVLIADPTNFILTRYNTNGLVLGEFSSVELQKKLLTLKTQYENLKLLSYFPVAIFIVSIITGLVIGIRQQIKFNAQLKQQADARQTEVLNSNELRWLSIDTKYIRQARMLAGLAPVLMLFSLSPMLLLFEHAKLFDALIGTMSGLFLFILTLSISTLFYLKSISNIKIGIQGHNITLKNHLGIETHAHISNVFYDNTTLYFEGVAVVYGNNKRSFFYKDDMQNYLLPFLKSATRINPIRMFYFLYKIKHPSFYFSLIIYSAIIIMLIFNLR